MIKEADKKGCNLYRDIRLKFARNVVEQAGLSSSIIGMGKIVDIQKLSWNDNNGKFTLIRACGGANKKIDKIDTSIIKGGYKTYMETVSKVRPVDNTFDDVLYPSKLDSYPFPENEVLRLPRLIWRNTRKSSIKTRILTLKANF